jgi:DNA replication and repair protein RecF
LFLQAIDSRDFRNLQPGRIEFGPGLNVLCGENGVGKSNVLEVIYCVCTTRSFRGASPGEMARVGAEGFRILAEMEATGVAHRLEFQPGRGRRELFLDGKRAGLGEVISRFPVLAFSARMLEVIRGGPRDRRRFLDRTIASLRPAYLQELGQFHRVLAQRNRLLRQGAGTTERQAWDEQFAVAAAPILIARRSIVGRLRQGLGIHASGFLPAELEVTLTYRPGVPLADSEDPREVQAQVRRELARGADAEQRAKHTRIGPHRDEMTIQTSGHDASTYASAGQQRKIVLALNVTILELQRESAGRPPLLLVDDLDAELDRDTTHRLLERLDGLQVVGASCRWDEAFSGAAGLRRFAVDAGAVRQLALPGTGG